MALAFIGQLAFAEFCGPDEIPDKIAVNDNGEVALGCRYNECPLEFNNPEAKSKQTPKCGNSYYELSCAGPLQWVGGIPQNSNLNKVVPLRCCSVEQLGHSRTEEIKIVEPGHVFEGQTHYDKVGNIDSYDIIKNAQKVEVGRKNDGTAKYALSVTVARLVCQPKRAAQVDAPEFAAQGFGDVAAADGTFQAGAPAGFDANAALAGADPALAAQLGAADPNFAAQLGDPNFGAGQFGANPFDAGFGQGLGDGLGGFGAEGLGANPFAGDLGAAGLAPPAPLGPGAAAGALPPIGGALGALGGAGAGVCFTGETMVETPSGPKMMKDLKIGDQVLAVDHGVVGFTPIKSFLHRLPEKKAMFHRISGADGSAVSMTEKHFIYTTPCDKMEPTMKWAQDVVPDKECLIRVVGEKQIPVKVTGNDVFESTGIYNPMTESATVIADGYLASCHNVYSDKSFMNALTKAAVRFQKWMSWDDAASEHVELPWLLQFCIDYASKLL